MKRRDVCMGIGVGALASLMPARVLAGPPSDTYQVSRAALLLDGVSVGSVRTAQVSRGRGMVKSVAADGKTRKNLSSVQFDPITIEVDFGMGKAFYEWIEASLAGAAKPKNASLVLLDRNGASVESYSLQDAVVSKVRFPAFDGKNKSAGLLTVALDPASVVYQPGGPTVSVARPSSAKKWITSNFRLTIDGLEGSTPGVGRIEPITFKVVPGRDPRQSKRTVSDVVLKVSAAKRRDLDAWFDTFVLQGKSSDERRGTIELLSMDLKQVLARVDLHNLGIFQLESEAVDSGRVTAHLYCESIGFHYIG